MLLGKSGNSVRICAPVGVRPCNFRNRSTKSGTAGSDFRPRLFFIGALGSRGVVVSTEQRLVWLEIELGRIPAAVKAIELSDALAIHLMLEEPLREKYAVWRILHRRD